MITRVPNELLIKFVQEYTQKIPENSYDNNDFRDLLNSKYFQFYLFFVILENGRWRKKLAEKGNRDGMQTFLSPTIFTVRKYFDRENQRYCYSWCEVIGRVTVPTKTV